VWEDGENGGQFTADRAMTITKRYKLKSKTYCRYSQKNRNNKKRGKEE
jgi:hypothetical protein